LLTTWLTTLLTKLLLTVLCFLASELSASSLPVRFTGRSFAVKAGEAGKGKKIRCADGLLGDSCYSYPTTAAQCKISKEQA
jgi:hypothetical protein